MKLDLTNKQNFLKLMADRVMLREGPVGVENVLRSLFGAYNKPGEEPMTERVLARIARLPVPVVSALVKEFVSAGVLSHGMPLRLDEAAVRVMSEKWGWTAAPGGGGGAGVGGGAVRGSGMSSLMGGVAGADSMASGVMGGIRRESARCAMCEGTGIAPGNEGWRGVLASLLRHNLGSAPETLTRLAALMHDEGALFGKDVLALGGTGAMAGAVALAGKALSPSGRLAKRVVATDPHERNLLYLRDAAVAEGVIIGLVRYEPRRPLPSDLEEEFDTVTVISSDDLPDLIALVTRASEATKEEGRVYLLCPPLRGEERLDTQREMLDLGLAIERIIPRFDAHPGSELDLYVLRAVGDD